MFAKRMRNLQNQEMPPDIRAATVGDAADLSAIRAQCFDKIWSPESFAEMLARTETICFMVPGVAYALAQKIPPESELITIAVISAYRRQKIAQRLLEKLSQELRGDAIHTLHLEVNEKLVAARALYEKLGFHPVGRRAEYYRNAAGAPEDAILMARQITV